MLNEAESVAGGSLEALRCAIATPRTAVLDLFRGDSNDDFGNGNQPVPPAPPSLSGDGGEAEDVHELPAAIAPQREALTGLNNTLN